MLPFKRNQSQQRQAELLNDAQRRHDAVQELQARQMELANTRQKVKVLEKRLELKLRRRNDDSNDNLTM